MAKYTRVFNTVQGKVYAMKFLNYPPQFISSVSEYNSPWAILREIWRVILVISRTNIVVFEKQTKNWVLLGAERCWGLKYRKERAGVSVTWNVLSWSGGHEFEPWLGRTWSAYSTSVLSRTWTKYIIRNLNPMYIRCGKCKMTIVMNSQLWLKHILFITRHDKGQGGAKSYV